MVNIAPPMGKHRGNGENKRLEHRRVIAGETHPVFAIANGNQDFTKAAVQNEPAEKNCKQQQTRRDVVHHDFCLVLIQVYAQESLKIRNAIDAAGIALLADDHDRHDPG
jgi:hypothetical protein